MSSKTISINGHIVKFMDDCERPVRISSICGGYGTVLPSEVCLSLNHKFDAFLTYG